MAAQFVAQRLFHHEGIGGEREENGYPNDSGFMGGTSDAGANPDFSGPLAPRQSSTSDIESFFLISFNDTWGPSHDALASIVVKGLALEQVV
ncbi:MAG: hypothetical protein WCC31_05450 [Terracidiphilus sp.]